MEVWARPADTYVAGFIGSPAMNFLSAALTEEGRAARLAAGPLLRFADGPRPGAEGRGLTLGIRPEHVTRAEGAPVTLMLDLVEPLGSETVVHGTLPGGERLTAKLLGAVPAMGSTLELCLPAEALHVFDAETGKRLDPMA
jgi:sn-glycerol 3-phosphate transport system ATP-binding protein